MRKIVRWDPPGSLPRRPYRDSVVLYAAMAVLIVVFAAVTGGSIVRAIVIGAFVFLAATAWSWRRWRERSRDDERRRT